MQELTGVIISHHFCSTIRGSSYDWWSSTTAMVK
jgi:hypothetical protein